MLQELTTKAPVAVAYVLAHKDAILPLLGGATGLSVTGLTLVHKLSDRVTGEAGTVKRKVFSYVLVQVLTVATSIAAFVVANVNPEHLYPWLATIVTAVHQLAVNPVYVKKVLPYLEYQATVKAATPSNVQLNIPEDVADEAAYGSGIFVSQ